MKFIPTPICSSTRADLASSPPGPRWGTGFIHWSSLERTSRFDIPSQTFGPFDDEEKRTRLNLGLTAGVDVAVEVTWHVFVVPQWRLSVIRRGNARNGGLSALGLPAVVSRAGIGIRAAF